MCAARGHAAMRPWPVELRAMAATLKDPASPAGHLHNHTLSERLVPIVQPSPTRTRAAARATELATRAHVMNAHHLRREISPAPHHRLHAF